MPYLRDLAFVLKKEPFREQDRRYFLYGREHGLLIAVARGSCLKKSKQAGHLEPFSVSEVMLAKGAAFDKLAVAKNRSNGTYQTNIPTLASYAVCGRLAELVVALTRPGISDVRIFYLLEDTAQAFSGLECEPSPERARFILAAASLKLLDFLGFAPNAALAEQAPENFAQLFSFIRRSPLADALRLTATKGELNYFCAFIEESFEHTHLENPRRIFEKTAAYLN